MSCFMYISIRRFSVMRVQLTSYFLMFLLAAIAKTSESSTYGTFEVRLRSLRPSDGFTNGILWTLCLTNFQVNPVVEDAFRFSEPQVASTSALQQSGIALPFDFAWPGSFSLFVRSRNATWPPNSEEAVFKKAFASENVTASDKWTEVELSDERSKTAVVLAYRVVCAEGHAGSYCEITCNAGGTNWRCTDDGKVMCAPGWKGTKCDEAICEGCKGSGQCIAGKCSCYIGWDGPNCDQCLRRDGCRHGTCQKPYECICDKGWGGLLCDQDLEYCVHHMPCKNGATCLNTGNGSYTCNCRPGYKGFNCEVRQRTCLPSARRGVVFNRVGTSKMCQNGGLCVQDSSGEYHCECQEGYLGDYCQNCSQCCSSDACQNGGTCILNEKSKDYTCVCPAGFAGSHCEDVVSVCEIQNQCKNGGSCINVSGQFACKCAPNYDGYFCEKVLNPCEANPCENNGRCSATGHGLYECQCDPGYQGKNCDIKIISCEQQPCGNGSTCVATPSGHKCKCEPCYTGADCLNVDEHCLIKIAHTWNSLSVSFLIVIAILTFLILVILIIFLCWKCHTQRSTVVDPVTENMLNAQRNRFYQLPSVDSKQNNNACEASTFRYKPVPVSRLKSASHYNHYEAHQRDVTESVNRENRKNFSQNDPQASDDLYAEVEDFTTDFPPLPDSFAAKLNSELRDFSTRNSDRRLPFNKHLDVRTNV